MSVAAAELPQMSGTLGSDEEINASLRKRLERGASDEVEVFVPR